MTCSSLVFVCGLLEPHAPYAKQDSQLGIKRGYQGLHCLNQFGFGQPQKLAAMRTGGGGAGSVGVFGWAYNSP